ncbi:MAG: hypothetical protein H0W75_02515 [Chitinophagaceae bacterium]|nr:hypothetical protein [Chitinophagaceae bacterium]
MFVKKYITAYCRISNDSIYKNGNVLFENKGVEVQTFLLSAYKHFDINYSRFYKMDNMSKLGWLASEMLLKDNFQKEKYKPEEIGIILSNANASLDTDEKYFAGIKDIPSPSLFVYTLPNIVTGEICIRNNFKGEDAFFVSDKFDSDFIKNYVAGLMDRNILQACICGWVELLREEYKVVLFLIEKSKTDNAISFSKENMNKIFDNQNEEM